MRKITGEILQPEKYHLYLRIVHQLKPISVHLIAGDYWESNIFNLKKILFFTCSATLLAFLVELLKSSVAMQEQMLGGKGFLVIGYLLEKVCLVDFIFVLSISTDIVVLSITWLKCLVE